MTEHYLWVEKYDIGYNFYQKISTIERLAFMALVTTATGPELFKGLCQVLKELGELNDESM